MGTGIPLGFRSTDDLEARWRRAARVEQCIAEPAHAEAASTRGAARDAHEVFAPTPMARALAEPTRAERDRLVAPDGASTREVALIEDLEALRARGASDWDVLARLSKEEPRTLQILYRTPGAQGWIAAIASHARLVDIVERIGGPLDAQLSWLRAAGVRAAPRDARRSAAKDAGAELARDVERFAAVLSAEAAVERATRDHLSAGGGGVLAAGTFETGRRVITAESARSAALRDAGLTPSTWDSARADAIAKFQARALQTAHAMLREGRRAVQAERARYERPSERAELVDGAHRLHELRGQITNLESVAYRPFAPTRVHADLRAVRERLAALERDLATRHPLALDPAFDVARVVGAADHSARAEITRTLDAHLDAIEGAHHALDRDASLVFQLDRVVARTEAELGAGPASALHHLVAQERTEVARREEMKRELVGLFALALGFASMGAGVIAVTAGAGGVVTSAVSLADSIERYGVASDLARTHFDRAKALAADDPSLFGLAFDVATFVFDAAAFAHGFRALGGHVERAIAASSPSELDEALTRVREAAIPAEGTVSGELVADAATASVLRARERAVLFAKHASEAAELGARWGLDERAIAGLLRLDEAARAVIVGVGDGKVIASLGHLADVSDEATRGLSRLVRARPEQALISELATTSSDRAAAIVRRLGDARATDADVAAIARRRDAGSARDGLRAIEAASTTELPLSITDELALERRLRVPVDVDPTLPGREVRVVFESKEGLVRDVRIVAGPRATGADLDAHVQVLEQLGRYRGLLGRATRLLDRAAQRIGRTPLRPGTRAFEARLELEKLPRLIEARQRELAGTIDPTRATKLRQETTSLERQLAQHERTLAALDAAPGRGFVAATDPATELREALERTLALGPEHDVDVVAGALRIDGVAVRGDDLVALAKRDPARAAAIVDVMKRVAAQGGRDALEGLTIGQLEKVADVFHARVAADFEAAMPAARALKQDVAGHKALDRAIASAAKEERAARGLDAKPKQAAYVFDRRAALDTVANRTDLTPEVIADLRESLTKIEDSGRFDRAGVDAVLRSIRDADDRGVAEYLAELKHGLHVLERGRVADGTLVHFAVKNGAGVKLAGRGYVFDGTNGAGRVLISDADVLYLGKDGKVHVDEVKHTAKALREKLETTPGYATSLVEWARTGTEPRAVSIAVAKEHRWTELLAQNADAEMTIVALLDADEVPVSIAGRSLDVRACAREAGAIESRISARMISERITRAEARQRELPQVPDNLIKTEAP